MSTRTIIEINHDHLDVRTAWSLVDLVRWLGHRPISELTHAYDPGVRILGQRHHSDPEWKQADKCATLLAACRLALTALSSPSPLTKANAVEALRNAIDGVER